MTEKWLWPSSDEINDFPDPLGFEEEWRPWDGTMADGPDRFAEIFCREHLQNSWDTIQERIATAVALGEPVPADFGVTYRFVRLVGEAALNAAEVLGLREHAERLAGMSDKDRTGNRLANSELAEGDFSSLTFLVATERFGEGMGGPWRTEGRAGVVSRLKSALIQTRSAKDNDASGGSWGHGKKAVANASMCRTVAVYTRHLPTADDDRDEPTTRRFLGVAYWRHHDLGERSHVGLGLLGAPSGDGGYGSFRPLEDVAADELVEALAVPGFDVRSPSNQSTTGSSYLIVEPHFSPQDLCWAIQRNWWPLLQKQPTSVRVIDENGDELSVDPAEWVELRPFLEASTRAAGSTEPRPRGDLVTDIGSRKVAASNARLPVGRLALTSDDSDAGWSWDDPETNCNLVALVRNDMVIAYQRFPKRQRSKPPFVRGVLTVDRVANAQASERLKMAEPHLHNVWNTDRSPSVPEYAADLARDVLESCRKAVASLCGDLKVADPMITHHFPEFSELFSTGPRKTKTPIIDPLPKGNRDISIQYVETRLDPSVTEPGTLRLMCTVRICLSRAGAKAAGIRPAAIRLGWGVLEERGPAWDATLLDADSTVLPPGFVLDDHMVAIGDLTAEPLEFRWRSGPFRDDWQVVPYPDVVLQEVES
jgi:hypothetical protein